MAAARRRDDLVAPDLTEQAEQLRTRRVAARDALAVLVASSDELQTARAELQRRRATFDASTVAKLSRRPS
jgi:hypothetical protein